jgi:hypothetical protein
MCKKMIYLVSFVLVLSLVSNASADLVGYWKFDEGSGTIAYDSSGNGNDGTIQGDPQWVAGKIAGALQFDGTDDYVEVPDSPSLDITDAITIAAWVFREADSGTWERIVAKSDSSLYDYWLQVTSGDSIGGGFLDIGGTAHNSLDLATGVSIPLNQWTHLVYVYDGTYAKGYVNGQLDKSDDIGSFTIRTSTRPLWVGRLQNSYNFDGLIDEVRIYDRALTVPEILGAMEGSGEVWPYALSPTPADGAMYADTWVSLSWRPGGRAVSHDVYLGDNFDDVNDGVAETFRGNQTSTNLIVGFFGFPYPDGLVPGTTYYWRIDEVNDTEPNSPWKGDVWSFMVPPKTAYDQYPADGAKFVDPDVELSWTGGFGAKLHTVYFGDNFDDVNDAVGGLMQADTTYTPGTLEFDKTYYWRVDEFDVVTTHKGDIWSFKTLPVIPISDPSLIGWWTLDEGMGTTAVDWSGHDNHGTLINGPQWVPGYDGDALEFDGADDYVNLPYTTDPTAYTIAAWIKPARTSPASIVVRTDNAGPTTNWSHQLRIDSSGVIEHYAWDGSERRVLGTTAIKAGTWYSVVAVATNDGNMRLYVNGQREGTATTVGTLWAGGDRFIIGSNSGHGMGWFEGVIDDIRIYDRALTQEEITIAMRGDTTRAWNPSPSNGSIVYIREATPLSWSPGDNASQHDVYFGTDRDAVVDADASDTTGIYRGRQGVTIYTPAEGVEWGGGPYFWRIDEYNTDATISRGNVWSFTVADFIEIDGIEDYNDYPPDEIFSTWIDGWEVPTNGSLAGHAEPPFAETGNVHGGSQSMPVYYENNFKYSEITMTLTQRNWTEEGVGVLSLWFYGDTSNAAERMYVNLNGIATIYHENPDAALIEEWTEWRIDLQEFAAQGVNLANVNTISIGFGDKNNLQAGGSGMVLFDDIRLYRPPAP